MGHMSTQCPNPKFQLGTNVEKQKLPKAKAHSFNMTVEEAQHNNEVIFINFLVNYISDRVLCDGGASRSFMSIPFYAQFDLPRSALDT